MPEQDGPDAQAALQEEARRVGLCVRCTRGRRTVSDRGAVFYRCTFAAIDARFAKYPVIPVRLCPAYAPA